MKERLWSGGITLRILNFPYRKLNSDHPARNLASVLTELPLFLRSPAVDHIPAELIQAQGIILTL